MRRSIAGPARITSANESDALAPAPFGRPDRITRQPEVPEMSFTLFEYRDAPREPDTPREREIINQMGQEGWMLEKATQHLNHRTLTFFKFVSHESPTIPSGVF